MPASVMKNELHVGCPLKHSLWAGEESTSVAAGVNRTSCATIRAHGLSATATAAARETAYERLNGTIDTVLGRRLPRPKPRMCRGIRLAVQCVRSTTVAWFVPKL